MLEKGISYKEHRNSIFSSFVQLLINARHCQPSKNRFDSNKRREGKKKKKKIFSDNPRDTMGSRDTIYIRSIKILL